MNGLLTDRYGRRITYLRLSVTDRCNLACRYCIPPEGRTWLPHHEILTYEEMFRIVRILACQGVRKIRITGGEPLVRENLFCLIRGIRDIEGIEDVTLTTNGILLADHIDELKESGIKRVNVSLDSLNTDIFQAITGRNLLNTVLDGIKAALAVGMAPVKINMVPMAGMNDTEIEDMASLSFDRRIHVRFIEEMPMGIVGPDRLPPITMNDVRKRIESRWGDLIPVLPSSQDGPARRFRIPGAEGEVGFIPAMTRHFCHNCNRIRLTAVGRIRPCLMNDDEMDIKSLIRNGAPDDKLLQLIKGALSKKGWDHPATPHVRDHMVSIGG